MVPRLRLARMVAVSGLQVRPLRRADGIVGDSPVSLRDYRI